MADNSVQSGADTIRDKDRTGVKTQIVGLDLGIGTGTESLMSGNMPVTGTGTAGTPATGVQTVQGITSGTPVPVSLATAPTTPVTGTFWQATQPVSLATNTPDVTDRAARLLGVISAGTNVIGAVKDAQDVGRQAVSLLIDNVAAVATEALVSYGGFANGFALTAGTAAFTVPAGRVFRIQSIQLTARGTAIDTVRVRVRALATVVVGSPHYAGIAVAIGANGGNSADVEPSREIEIGAGLQVGLSVVGATTSTYVLSVMGYTYVP